MLYDYLAMTKTEAVEILTQKYENSINTVDHIEQQALMMPDVMTQGLVKQVPQQFRKNKFCFNDITLPKRLVFVGKALW